MVCQVDLCLSKVFKTGCLSLDLGMEVSGVFRVENAKAKPRLAAGA